MKRKFIFAVLFILLALCMALSSFAGDGLEKTAVRSRRYDGRFGDVNETDWFYEGVTNAFEMELMSGTAFGSFSPNSNITIAETVALAVNINCRYTEESVEDAESSEWYEAFFSYAVNHGIITEGQYPSPEKTATRREFAEILSFSLPDEAFSPINSVKQGSVWDITDSGESTKRIYMLYDAGIVCGSDKYGSFHPDKPITRGEGAIIAARIADSSLRITFSLEAKPEVPKGTITKLNGRTYYLPEGSKYTFDATGRDNQPYLVAVNRQCCTVTVYGKDTAGDYTVPVKAFVCSVGRKGHGTPTGRWDTTDKYEWRIMVDGTYGRYAIRFAPGGYLFHSVPYYSRNKDDLEYAEYNKLGEAASLGCVRMSVADVKWLYDNCPSGFSTIVYDDPSPGPLGKPEAVRVDVTDKARRGWDPTDPDPANPWKGE